MNAVAILNSGIHTLILSLTGWAVLKWGLRDARMRSWAALATICLAALGPWLLHLRPAPAPSTPTASAPLPSWQPDWKVKISNAPAEPILPETVPAAESEPKAPARWSFDHLFRILSVTWLLGAALTLWQLLSVSFRSARWHRRLRRPYPFEAARLPATATVGAVPVRVFRGPGSPCVSGLWRPVVAVPENAFAELTPAQWDWVLRHEEEHRRAGDPLTAWLLGWLRVLYWWNPFFHGLLQQWTQAREEICDAAAVAAGADPCAYAELLLAVAATPHPAPGTFHMATSQPARRLKARLAALLAGHRVSPRTGWEFQAAFAILATALLLLVGGTGFAGPADGIRPQPETGSTPATAPPEGDRGLVTRTFRVRPDFLRVIPAFQGKSAQEILMGLGVAFPEGSSAVFVPNVSQLIVHNTPAQFQAIEEALEEYFNRMPLQAYISTKWVEIDTNVSDGPAEVLALLGAGSPPGEDRNHQVTTLPEAKFQTVLRALSQRKGVDLFSSPSVMTRLGQKATVEVIREIKGPAHHVSTTDANFLGVRNEFTVTLEKDGLRIALRCDLHCLSGIRIIDGLFIVKDGVVPAGATLVKLSKSASTSVPQGHTLFWDMGETAPGRKVLFFATAAVISPAGTPATEADIHREFNRKPLPVAPPPQKQLPQQTGPPVEVVVHQVRLQASASATTKALGDLLTPRAQVNNTTPPGVETTAPTGPSPTPGSGDFTVLGVLSANQAAVVLQSVRQDARAENFREHRDTSSAVLPHLTFPIAAPLRQNLVVTPEAHAQDGTIDLTIQKQRQGKTASVISTITVWSGQTVVLGHPVQEGSPPLGEIFFITPTTTNKMKKTP